MGCFKEKSIGDRLFKGDQLKFINSLNLDKCITYCGNQGFAYAGLQYREECFCSKEMAPLESAANEEECNMRCSGNKEKICGGSNRLSVYSTAVLSSTYMGCVKEKSIEDRLFKGGKVDFVNTLTIDKCITYCGNRGFAYAGLQYRQECFCSKEMPRDVFANEEECNMKCRGNSEEICGGALRLSVYATGVYSSTYVGCFKERSIEDRLLKGDHFNFVNTLNHVACTTYCGNKGFAYAGLQYGIECFCSKERPPLSLAADEKDCNMKCSGNSDEMCGGPLRLSIYSSAGNFKNQ